MSGPGIWKDGTRTTIRVSTYNIDGADNAPIDRLAARVHEDDLSGIQEARADTLLGTPNQVRQMADVNQQGWVFAPSQRRLLSDYAGNGLLSRFHVCSWENRPLVYTSIDNTIESRRYRSMLVAKTAIGGHPVTVIVTHLDRSDMRYYQAEEVFAEFAKHEHVILLADLNSRPQDTRFTNLLTQAAGSDMVGIALGEKDLPYRVDWIVTRGFSLIEGDVAFSDISDHPYYWVELEIIP